MIVLYCLIGYIVLGLVVLLAFPKPQPGFVMPPMWYLAAMVLFFPSTFIIMAYERLRKPPR